MKILAIFAVTLSILFSFIYLTTISCEADDVNFLRSAKTMPDGTIDIGDLIVEVSQKGQEVKIQIVKFDSRGNGKTEWITTSELSKLPVGKSDLTFSEYDEIADNKLYYGVSADNKLIIFIKATINNVKVIQDLTGNYDVKDIKDKSKVILVEGKKMDDGRIKVRSKK